MVENSASLSEGTGPSCLHDTTRVVGSLNYALHHVLPRLEIEPEMAELAGRLLSEEIERRQPGHWMPGDAVPTAAFRDHDAAMVLHGLGQLYLHSANKRRALALLLIAGRIVPTNTAVLYALSEAFIASESPTKAYNALSLIEQIQGPSAALAKLQGRALWLAGDRDQAKRYFRDAIAEGPS